MGVLFEAGENLVWNPSPQLAQIFLTQLRAIEVAIGVQSGIGKLVADEVQVDPTALCVFVESIAELLEAKASTTMNSLIAGPFAIAFGILAACGPDVPTFPGVVGQLACRGVALVAGRGRPGSIYELGKLGNL